MKHPRRRITTAVLALALAGCAAPARADLIQTFDISGTFEDGATLGGTVTIDTTIGSVIMADVTVGAPDSLEFTFIQSQGIKSGQGDTYQITLGTSATDLPRFIFSPHADDLIGYAGGPIASQTDLYKGYASGIRLGGDGVILETGKLSLAAVPEPSNLIFGGLAGLAGTGYAWRRRRRMLAIG